jgi:hypothetical protein
MKKCEPQFFWHNFFSKNVLPEARILFFRPWERNSIPWVKLALSVPFVCPSVWRVFSPIGNYEGTFTPRGQSSISEPKVPSQMPKFHPRCQSSIPDDAKVPSRMPKFHPRGQSSAQGATSYWKNGLRYFNALLWHFHSRSGWPEEFLK